jgi:WD40 repeat protein
MNIDIRHILHLLDGKRIIMYSPNGSFRVWDLETDTQVGEEWEDEDQEVETIVISPDGKKIASAGSRDGAVKLWNVDTGKVIKTLLTGHTGRVGSVSWSPDGGQMVSGSEDGTFRVWDVESGKTILGPINCACDVNVEFEPNDSRALYVCYSPDAKMIATGGDDPGLQIWDANTGKLLKPSDGSYTLVKSLACMDLGWKNTYRWRIPQPKNRHSHLDCSSSCQPTFRWCGVTISQWAHLRKRINPEPDSAAMES